MLLSFLELLLSHLLVMQPDRILIIVWFDSDEDLISCLCSEANGIHLLLIIASGFTTLVLKM
jgi:hypothetical protein